MTYLILTIALALGAYFGLQQVEEPQAGVKQARAVEVVPSPSPVTTAEIVKEIAEVWKDEPKADIVRAINCFYSESGLRAEAVSKPNKNGTIDAGVAQINDVHKMSVEERLDYKKNIRKAYQIYKGRGSNFEAWYAKGCK